MASTTRQPVALHTQLAGTLDIIHTVSPTQPPGCSDGGRAHEPPSSLTISCPSEAASPPWSDPIPAPDDLPPGFTYIGCGVVTTGLPSLAAAYASARRRALDAFGLTVVLTVADETQPDARVPLPREFVPMRDFACTASVDGLARAVGLLRTQLSTPGGKRYALVLDRFNISRAPAVAAAYLMATAGMSLHAALAHVAAVHAGAVMSLDMQHALRSYEERELARCSATPTELHTAFLTRHPSLSCIPTPVAREPMGVDPLLKSCAPPCALDLTRRELGAALRDAFLVREQDHCPASLVLPDLWVGDMDAASDCSWLATHGITAVVNCAAECGPKATCSMPPPCNVCGAGGGTPVTRQSFPIVENAFFDATHRLRAAAAAIHAARSAGQPCLVHCMVGMNRSVSAVVTYMMASHRVTLLDALAFVRSRRAIAYPNAEMFPNLLRLEREMLLDALFPRQAELPVSVLDVMPPDVHRQLVAQAESVRRPPIVFGVHAADEAQDETLQGVRGTIPADAVQWLHKRLFRGGVKALEQIWGE